LKNKLLSKKIRFFTLRESFKPSARADISALNSFSAENSKFLVRPYFQVDSILTPNRVSTDSKGIRLTPVLAGVKSYKGVYNYKHFFIRSLDYILANSSNLLETNLLYNCKYKTKKDILVLKRFKTKKKFTNILHNNVFFSGFSLVNLFLTRTFLEENYNLISILIKKEFFFWRS